MLLIHVHTRIGLYLFIQNIAGLSQFLMELKCIRGVPSYSFILSLRTQCKLPLLLLSSINQHYQRMRMRLTCNAVCNILHRFLL
jgi:hypothetical protein